MTLDLRQRALFLLTLARRPATAGTFFALFPQSDSAALTRTLGNISAERAQDTGSAAARELQRLGRARRRTFLADTHDDWIADVLKAEPPEIVAAVLRYLPPERVAGVLDALPPETVRAMPALAATYAVPTALVESLRLKFEEQFICTKTLDPDAAMGFEGFCLLDTNRLSKALLHMGYREIAFGLAGLPEPTRRLVLGRLAPNDRERVEEILRQEPVVAGSRSKKAQVHLIGGEINPVDPRRFVRDLGYLIYAKALLYPDLDDVGIVKKKLSRVDAQALQDQVDLHVPRNTEASVIPYREDVLAALKAVVTPNG